jgi:hypothetical protein
MTHPRGIVEPDRIRRLYNMNNAIFHYLMRIPVVSYHGPRAYDNNGKEECETTDNKGCRYKENGS